MFLGLCHPRDASPEILVMEAWPCSALTEVRSYYPVGQVRLPQALTTGPCLADKVGTSYTVALDVSCLWGKGTFRDWRCLSLPCAITHRLVCRAETRLCCPTDPSLPSVPGVKAHPVIALD